MTLMTSSALPLRQLGRGKVRDIYEVDAERLLLMATDRVSAFDVVMGEAIPYKGAVLTQISAYWFRRLADLTPYHLISADASEIARMVPALAGHRGALASRLNQ
jgi:phosphoribosylaminoimidazole-succinocarboxamide synthase